MDFFETNYDGHTLLSGDVRVVHDSFDHAFGREKLQSVEVENFEVRVWIGDNDLDLSGFLRAASPNLYGRLKTHFLEAYLSKGFD